MPFRLRTAVGGATLATAAVLLCPAAAVARPAAAPAPPGWSAAPDPGAGAAPGAPDRPFFYLEGAPGTVRVDRLSLSNPTGHALSVRLRGAGSGAGAWLTPASNEVRIPPHTRAGVPFTVTVPRDAAPGERAGTLLATGVGKGAGRRISVPLHLRVTGPELSALTVEKVSVRRAGGAALIRYTLVNRGTTVLRPRIAVRADGLFGPLLRRAARAQPAALAPGRAVDLTETWSGPPALDAVEVRLTATAAGGAHDAATASYSAVPRGVLAAPLPLLAAGAGGLVVLRRRGRGTGTGGSRGEGAAPGPDGGTLPGGDEPADAAPVLAGTGPGARA
ncbi:COG1470 family protein [Streptomyces kronopolitis]|uniref:COG1470 family protein n=1 Tax=Streptomyces kronopolitis TaxID=1612435 RepID=UPI003D978FBB